MKQNKYCNRFKLICIIIIILIFKLNTTNKNMIESKTKINNLNVFLFLYCTSDIMSEILRHTVIGGFATSS